MVNELNVLHLQVENSCIPTKISINVKYLKLFTDKDNSLWNELLSTIEGKTSVIILELNNQDFQIINGKNIDFAYRFADTADTHSPLKIIDGKYVEVKCLPKTLEIIAVPSGQPLPNKQQKKLLNFFLKTLKI
eukprot:UN05750